MRGERVDRGRDGVYYAEQQLVLTQSQTYREREEGNRAAEFKVGTFCLVTLENL